VGDDTLGGGGRRVADGAGRPVPVSTAAFFLAAGADGVNEREQQTAFFLAAGVDGTGEREQRTSRAGVAEVADVSGMSRAGGSSGRRRLRRQRRTDGKHGDGSLPARSLRVAPPHGSNRTNLRVEVF
jgi:hypothetical protein